MKESNFCPPGGQKVEWEINYKWTEERLCIQQKKLGWKKEDYTTYLVFYSFSGGMY